MYNHSNIVYYYFDKQLLQHFAVILKMFLYKQQIIYHNILVIFSINFLAYFVTARSWMFIKSDYKIPSKNIENHLPYNIMQVVLFSFTRENPM